MASSSSVEATGRVFTGDTEDALEYKRWKTWILNKLLTLESKVPEAARGAYVYTLLGGKALDCIEHLDPSEYQKSGGEKVILDLLDRRFPQKDSSDEMSETLTAVFGLRAAEGETLKVWISRAGELFDNFDRCQRKCKVSFPEEARGWLILNRSGLNEEQKAVVLARSNGALKQDDIGRSMRSCYPDYVVPKRRSFGASLVEAGDELVANNDDESDAVIQEVEALLADHEAPVLDEPDEVFDESEVAEALAVTWKEKRKELSRMQRNRRFGPSADLRKSYRVEIEELKKKTRCHKCQQVGHWSRECKAGGKGKSKGSTGSNSNKSGDTGAAMVEHFTEQFVAAVMLDDQSKTLDTLTLLRQKRADHMSSPPSTWSSVTSTSSPPLTSEVMLVSSPGFGVIDSGCGRTIGQETLAEFEHLWKAKGIPTPVPFAEVNHFKFGNGQRETTEFSVKLPVVISGRSGSIRAAIVKGAAPLLISRSALQTLEAVVNFGRDELSLFSDQITVPLSTNAAGQYVINLLDRVEESSRSFQEVLMNEMGSSHESEPVPLAPLESAMTLPATESSSELAPGRPTDLQVWSRSDSFLNQTLTTGKQGPCWQSVRRRRVLNQETHEVLFDEWISPHKKKSHYHHKIPVEVMHVITEFHFVPQEKTTTVECLPIHCQRQLSAQIRSSASEAKSMIGDKPFLVAEVFCPPRCAPLVEGVNGICRSYDLSTGFDFTKPAVRDQVAKELYENPPDLLILSPPCTHEGGWFNLNACTMDPQEYARKVRRSRVFIRFCSKLFQQQVDLGGRALLEHPKGSKLWTYSEIHALIEHHHLLTCHMCRFGLHIPKSKQLIRKATHLLVTHEDMKGLARECPGSQHPKHVCHQVVAGSNSTVGQISTFAGKYTPQFVEAIMENRATVSPTEERVFGCVSRMVP